MSLSKVSEFRKEVPTWRVYPRVHYFVRRYIDLHPRFHRVTGTFPKSFQDQRLLYLIDELSETCRKSLAINVIGWKKLDISRIVVSMKPWEKENFSELQGPAQTTIHICYVKLEKLDEIGLKKVNELLKYFDSQVANRKRDLYMCLFIVIDTDTQPFEEDLSKFRQTVFETVKHHFGDEWEHRDRIIFGSKGSILGSKISELLERRLVEGFYTVLEYLERFSRKTKQYSNDTVDIIHSDLVVRSIQSLLRDDIGLADMRKVAETDKSEETEGMSDDDKFLQHFLKQMARLMKCAVVEPFSMKYNIPPWICNLLLMEINFETKIMESVSRNTRHHLRKLNEFSRDFDKILETYKRKANMGRGNQGARKHEYFIRFVSYKFDFIVYPLQNDMSKVISDAEKTMASACNIIVVMGKMIFEVEGYLEQTITEKYEPTAQTPEMPKGLRLEILKLADVHAVGTIYDVVEVHVSKETDTLKDDLSMLMQKYEYRLPYRVKTVIQQATAMMADIQHENGKLIKSPCPENKDKYREGTLGAFVTDNRDNTLYAVTCAHVVNNPHKEEHDVYIQDRGLRLRKFGKSQRRLTINTGVGLTPLVDIAAVMVDLSFVRHCIRRMKDENGINRSAALTGETVSQLVGRFVYKHGAISGMTRGIICSTDLLVAGGEEGEYLLLIESLPGDFTSYFAKKGDSGAVICTSAVDTDAIKVVGMLSAGDYKLTGEDTQEKYLCFLMKTGLKKLQDRSGVPLIVP